VIGVDLGQGTALVVVGRERVQANAIEVDAADQHDRESRKSARVP
jgi:hypothetical protein